jgi:hypothetical protein
MFWWAFVLFLAAIDRAAAIIIQNPTSNSNWTTSGEIHRYHSRYPYHSEHVYQAPTPSFG